MRGGTFVSICLATTCLTSVAFADDSTVETIVVTGTADKTTTALTSMAPLDVISADTLRDTGFLDLARSLETTEPELNFPRATAQPFVSTTRPVFLNGLYPDETLVLVDGKRWHSSAVLDTNNGLGNGTASADLSTIPLSAIARIEVLRDGASAEYGSDAIAGVVNVILKSNSSGGLASVQGGITERGDGANGLFSVNDGFELGDGGFLSLTGEMAYQGSTDRTTIDQRYDRKTWYVGDPLASSFNVGANADYPLAGLGDLYGNIFVSHKTSMDRPVFETPGYSPLYPNGFLPRDTVELWDVNDTVGIRGDVVGDVHYDLSNTFGRSSAGFYARNTANQSLGAASPTSFNSGAEIYFQDVTDLSFTRALPEILAGGNIAAGAQFRYEHYQILDGDAASTYEAGAASLNGFYTRIPVDNGRTAAAGYVDLELLPVSWLTLGGAGRYDHYSDFGGALTYKTSARAEATDWLSFRASMGTGFRAPSMQQEYYNSISTLANGPNKSLVNVGTFQVDDPVSVALGATPLKPETSHNYSVGAVMTPFAGLSVTADLFRINVANRITLINSQSGAVVNTALAAAGITNVQQVAFFTNGANTRTTGGNVTVAYNGEFDSATPFTLSGGFERNESKIESIEVDSKAPSLVLLSQHSQYLLTTAQPADKLSAEFAVFHGPYSATLDVTRYGGSVDDPLTPLVVQNFSPNWIVDLSASVEIFDGGTLTAGVLNVGDVYPDKWLGQQYAAATFGYAYPYGPTSPDGTDGRSYYIRFSLRL
jgi:iron complex outermembrane recepter protein